MVGRIIFLARHFPLHLGVILIVVRIRDLDIQKLAVIYISQVRSFMRPVVVCKFPFFRLNQSITAAPKSASPEVFRVDNVVRQTD